MYDDLCVSGIKNKNSIHPEYYTYYYKASSGVKDKMQKVIANNVRTKWTQSVRTCWFKGLKIYKILL